MKVNRTPFVVAAILTVLCLIAPITLYLNNQWLNVGKDLASFATYISAFIGAIATIWLVASVIIQLESANKDRKLGLVASELDVFSTAKGLIAKPDAHARQQIKEDYDILVNNIVADLVWSNALECVKRSKNVRQWIKNDTFKEEDWQRLSEIDSADTNQADKNGKNFHVQQSTLGQFCFDFHSDYILGIPHEKNPFDYSYVCSVTIRFHIQNPETIYKPLKNELTKSSSAGSKTSLSPNSLHYFRHARTHKKYIQLKTSITEVLDIKELDTSVIHHKFFNLDNDISLNYFLVGAQCIDDYNSFQQNEIEFLFENLLQPDSVSFTIKNADGDTVSSKRIPLEKFNKLNIDEELDIELKNNA